jgi:hypothetical protein
VVTKWCTTAPGPFCYLYHCGTLIHAMRPETFRTITTDPEAWRTKARTVRTAAETLWGSALGFFSGMSDNREQAIDLFVERLHTAQFLYGLAVETALKARIIERDPANVRFVEKMDAQGVVVEVRLQRIGADLGPDGHDLVKLAEVAGVLGPSASTPVFAVKSDQTAIKEILAFLTDCVRWSGRYPAPKSSNTYYRPESKIPSRILGAYMRDWLDQLLDALLLKHEADDGSEQKP